jgi:hypothetical protein
VNQTDRSRIEDIKASSEYLRGPLAEVGQPDHLVAQPRLGIARTAAAFSPTPAVNTSAWTPPSPF